MLFSYERIAKIHGIPYEIIDIIIVASINPHIIAGNDFLNFISRREAIKEPVHAPVPGSGIPTNRTKPRNSYFLI